MKIIVKETTTTEEEHFEFMGKLQALIAEYPDVPFLAANKLDFYDTESAEINFNETLGIGIMAIHRCSFHYVGNSYKKSKLSKANKRLLK